MAPLFWLCLLSSLQLSVQYSRPIWNIAHMVNDLDHIQHYLHEGANAIEADVTFDDDGMAKFTYHGFPCDCWRYCWDYSLLFQYLVKVRRLTTPDHADFHENFVLLLLDCKVSTLKSIRLLRIAGEDLAKKMIIHLWQRGQGKSVVRILLSIPHTAQIQFIKSFRATLEAHGLSHLESKIGWDISGNESPEKIEKELFRIGINDSIWLSDGITNCVPRSVSRLVNIIGRRSLFHTSITKAYFWTIDRETNLKKALSLGVDGIITNKPNRLAKLLYEDERVRIATIHDDPWLKVVDHARYHAQPDSESFNNSNQEDFFIECSKKFPSEYFYSSQEQDAF